HFSNRSVDRCVNGQGIHALEVPVGGGPRHERLLRDRVHRWLPTGLHQPRRRQQQILAGAQLLVGAFSNRPHGRDSCCMIEARSSHTCSCWISPASSKFTTCSKRNESGRFRPSSPNGRPGARPSQSDSSTRKFSPYNLRMQLTLLSERSEKVAS